MSKRFQQILILFIATMILASCALFRPKCPIPNCETRKYHQHALNFDMKALRKQARKKKMDKIKSFFGIKKKAPDSTDIALTDSLATTDDLALTEESEEETSEVEQTEEPPIEQELEEPKKKKKKKKKKKEEDSLEEDELSFEDEESLGGEEPKKKKFRWPWQKSDEEKYLEEQAEIESEEVDTELEEVKAVKEEDYAKKWRSRKWRFWGNQNPKVGQRWKAPKKK